MNDCAVDQCDDFAKVKGLCKRHYYRAWRTGTTDDRPYSDPSERFWSHVEKSAGCWEWTSSKNTYGYGTMRVGRKVKKAHRLAYEFDVGPIPDGLHIDHICRNRGCVRPAHLRPVTPKQNTENLDGPHGHNVTSGVRGVYKTSNGKWQARTSHNGKIYSAGHFATIAEAEAAVIALRNRLFTHNDADRRDS